MKSQQANATGSKRALISTLVGLSACCLIVGLAAIGQPAGAMQLGGEQADQSGRISSSGAGAGANSASLALIENPELTARVLDNLLRSIVLSASAPDYPILNGAQKRGLDLGISRGFSGSQAGKHLMGLSAASFANGPGR